MLRPFLYSLERASVIQTGLIYPGKNHKYSYLNSDYIICIAHR